MEARVFWVEGTVGVKIWGFGREYGVFRVFGTGVLVFFRV